MDRHDLNTPFTAGAAMAAPWPRGHRIGNFELLEATARSPGGILYRAWDHALARPVAVKEFLPEGLAERGAGGELRVAPHAMQAVARARDALVGTWRTLAGCDHPALARILHQFEAHGSVYGVMPWYAGRPFDAMPAQGDAPLDEAALRLLLDDALGALEAFHQSGHVHGAIGGAKLLCLDSGRAMLLGPGAPLRGVDRVGAVPPGPWADLEALAATFDALARRCGVRPGPDLRSALDASLSPDRARRPLNVAQWRAGLAGDTAAQTPAPAAPGGTAPRDAEGEVDSAAAEVIRRVLASIPDQPPAPPRRGPVRSEPVAPVMPQPLREVERPVMVEPVFGEAPPPEAPVRPPPIRDASGRWTVWIGLGLIAMAGGAMVADSIDPARARALFERWSAVLSPAAGSGAASAPVAQTQEPSAEVAPLPAPATAALPAPSGSASASVAPAAPTPAPERVEVAPDAPAGPVTAVTPAAPVPPPPAAPRAEARPAARTPAREAAPPPPSSPRAACGARTDFSLYRCMQQQCRLDRWYAHAQCVRLRTSDSVDG